MNFVYRNCGGRGGGASSCMKEGMHPTVCARRMFVFFVFGKALRARRHLVTVNEEKMKIVKTPVGAQQRILGY